MFLWLALYILVINWLHSSVWSSAYVIAWALCNVQTAVTVFDLLDYYESCERLNISYNKNLGIRGWQACARFIKKVCIVTSVVSSILQYSVPLLTQKILPVPSILQILLQESIAIVNTSILVCSVLSLIHSDMYQLDMVDCTEFR